MSNSEGSGVAHDAAVNADGSRAQMEAEERAARKVAAAAAHHVQQAEVLAQGAERAREKAARFDAQAAQARADADALDEQAAALVAAIEGA